MQIVVGVDGSEHARAALRWAVDEAQMRGAEVLAVHVYTAPVSDASGGEIPGGWNGSLMEAVRRAAEQFLEEEVATVQPPEVPIKRLTTHEAQPARALTEQAGAGDLLVVGSRGHGSLANVLLGSVSQRCVQLATCPVVVVHAET